MVAPQASTHSVFVCSRGKNMHFHLNILSCGPWQLLRSSYYSSKREYRAARRYNKSLFDIAIISLDVTLAHVSPDNPSTFAQAKGSPGTSGSFIAAA